MMRYDKQEEMMRYDKQEQMMRYDKQEQMMRYDKQEQMMRYDKYEQMMRICFSSARMMTATLADVVDTTPSAPSPTHHAGHQSG